MADYGERELLLHQEAKIKAGLDKAIQHKEKLLEFDRNRYKMHNLPDCFCFLYTLHPVGDT